MDDSSMSSTNHVSLASTDRGEEVGSYLKTTFLERRSCSYLKLSPLNRIFTKILAIKWLKIKMLDSYKMEVQKMQI